MKIDMTVNEAQKLAADFYNENSKPLSMLQDDDRPFDIEWWKSYPQPESSESDRHSAAMRLYLTLAARAKHALGPESFPARFDFESGRCMRPDKGVIKVFLSEGLIGHRFLGAQLIFDLTEVGKRFATSK